VLNATKYMGLGPSLCIFYETLVYIHAHLLLLNVTNLAHIFYYSVTISTYK